MPLFEVPVENNKHPNFEWRGVVSFLCEVTLFEYNVSTSLSPIVVPFSVTVVINIVKVEYLTRVFFFLSFSSLLLFSSRGRIISMHFVQMLGSILFSFFSLFVSMFQ